MASGIGEQRIGRIFGPVHQVFAEGQTDAAATSLQAVISPIGVPSGVSLNHAEAVRRSDFPRLIGHQYGLRAAKLKIAGWPGAG
jgi:hypothetical protein